MGGGRDRGRRHRSAGLGRLCLLALLVVGGCWAGPDRSEPADADRPARERVTVASFDFSESRLLGEVYAQALERAGFPVERRLGLGSREIVEPALEQGLVDVVPEYSGSALRFLARTADAATADAERTHDRLRRAFAERDVRVLDRAEAENRNTLAVRRDTADRFGLATVSDLRPVAGRLVLGGPPECPERPACLRGFEDVYRLRFERFQPLDQARNVAAALEAGEIDVGVLFSTDPSIADFGFVALTDDGGLQPAENVVPVVREDLVAEHGAALVDVLDAVTEDLTTRELVDLNRRAQVDGEGLPQVAADWLASRDESR